MNWYAQRHPDGRLEVNPLAAPEFGILLDDGALIVGPGWASHAEVLDSFHAFGVRRVYGALVSRSPTQPEWKVA